MIELDKIYNEDCLEGMKRIPDGSVDAIICDLPYGTTCCKWDSVIPFEPLWEQYRRIAKQNAAVVLFAGEPFTSALIMSNIKEYRQKLTWLKTRPTNVFNAKKQFMNWTEDIVVFYRQLPTFNPQMRTDGQFTGRKVQHKNHDRSNGTPGQTGEKAGYVHEGNGGLFYPKSVLEYSNVHNGGTCLHPTQKPVELIRYLIRTYSNPGDTILDNCIGSGTMAIAAMREGRHFIGFELNEEYFGKAVERIEREREVMTAVIQQTDNR
jgi:site-specific DNA-methyltransferase (adenine-specific)